MTNEAPTTGLFDDIPKAPPGLFDDIPMQSQAAAAGNAAIQEIGGIGGRLSSGVGAELMGLGHAAQNSGQPLLAADKNATAFDEKQRQVMDRIDQGEQVDPQEDALGYGLMDAEGRKALRTQYDAQMAAAPAPGTGPLSDVGTAINKAGQPLGQALESAGKELHEFGNASQAGYEKEFPVGPENEKTTAVRVTRGLTGMLPYIAESLAGPVGIGAAAAQAGTETYGQVYDLAKSKGASDDEAHQAAGLSGLFQGGLMAVPLAKTMEFAETVPAAFRSKFVDGLMEVGKSSGTMIGYDQMSRVADNVVAKETFDPKRNVMEGVEDPAEMVATGIVGAALPVAGMAGRAAMAAAKRRAAAADEISAAAEERRAQASAAAGKEDGFPYGASPPPPPTSPPPKASQDYRVNLDPDTALWHVLDADGKRVGPAHETSAAAEAYAAGLAKEPTEATGANTQRLALPPPENMRGRGEGFTVRPSMPNEPEGWNVQLPPAPSRLALPWPADKANRGEGFIMKPSAQPSEPAIPDGMTRLYRAEGTPDPTRTIPEWISEAQRENGHTEAQGRWFTADKDNLNWYLKDVSQPARTFYVDVPTSEIKQYRVSNIAEQLGGRSVRSFSKDPENEFFIPRHLANQKIEIPSPSPEPLKQLPSPTTLYGEGFTVGAAQAGSPIDRAIFATQQFDPGSAIDTAALATAAGVSGKEQTATLLTRLSDRGLIEKNGRNWVRPLPPPEPFEPYYNSAVKAVSDGNFSLQPDVLSKQLGIDDPRVGKQLLSAMAARGAIRQTQRGFSRNPVRGPLDMLQFLASRGGIRDDEGHDLVNSMDAQRPIAGFGSLVRANGMNLDQAGEALWQAGYFGVPSETPRPTVPDVLDHLGTAFTGRKIYSEFDRDRVQAAEDAAQQTKQDAQLKTFGQELDSHAQAGQISLRPEERATAMSYIQGGMSPEDALYHSLEEHAVYGAQQDATLAKEQGDVEHANIPVDLGKAENPGGASAPAGAPPERTPAVAEDRTPPAGGQPGQSNPVSGGEGLGGLGEPADLMAPAYYSALTQAAESAKQDKAPAAQWMGMLKNMPGVKPEEIAWSGVEDWLKDQQGPVTKQALVDFLRANQVGIKEVVRGGPEGQPTQYHKYMSPGGTNPREMLFTLPQKDAGKWEVFDARDGKTVKIVGSEAEAASLAKSSPYYDYGIRGDDNDTSVYRSAHWDEPNVLAHVRMDDRTGPNGERILHVAEVQSDWHQEGRKKGYAEGEPPPPIQDFDSWLKGQGYQSGMAAPHFAVQWRGRSGPDFSRWQQEMNARMEVAERYGKTVPDAPFKTTWSELAMRRILRYAAEHGYDKVSWDTGDTNANRYDLSKHIHNISWKENGTLLAHDYNGNKAIEKYPVAANDLPNLVGKEIAQKLIDSKIEAGDDLHRLSDLDLKVGGEGMRGFYDKILPDYLRKYGKKWGARVHDIALPGAEKYEVAYTGDGWSVLDQTKRGTPDALVSDHQTKEETQKEVDRLNAAEPPIAHAIDITPEMRASLLAHGVALFDPKGISYPTKFERIYRPRTVAELKAFDREQFATVRENPAPAVRPSGMARAEYERWQNNPWTVDLPNSASYRFPDRESANEYAGTKSPPADERAALKIVNSDDPWNAFADELRARGVNVIENRAKTTESRYIKLPDIRVKDNIPLELRWSLHSKTAPVGGNSRNNTSTTWEFRSGSKPDLVSKYASALAIINRLTNKLAEGDRQLPLFGGDIRSQRPMDIGLFAPKKAGQAAKTETPLRPPVSGNRGDHFAKTSVPYQTHEEAHLAARDYVLREGAKTGNEHLVLVDKTGNVINAKTSFSQKHVIPDPSTAPAFVVPGADTVLHHNHPTGRGLSEQDVGVLANLGVKWIVAHGHDGSMSAASLSDGVRSFLEGNPHFRAKIQNDMGKMWISLFHKTGSVMIPLIDKGEMSLRDAEKIAIEYTLRAMANSGIIDYVSTHEMPLPDALRSELEKVSANAAKNFTRNSQDLYRWSDNWSPDRSADNVQLADGIRRLLPRDGGVAAGRADTSGGSARPPGLREGESPPRSDGSERNSGLNSGIGDSNYPSFSLHEPEGADEWFGSLGRNDPIQGRAPEGRPVEAPHRTPEGHPHSDAVSNLLGAAGANGATTEHRAVSDIVRKGLTSVKNLNPVERYTIFPRTLASLDDMSGQLWAAWKARDHAGDANIEALRGTISPTFLRLPNENRERVYAALELARIQNLTDDGKSPVTVKNTDSWFAQKSKPGQTIALDPVESTAYREALALGKKGADIYLDALAKRGGWSGPADPDLIAAAARQSGVNLPEGKKLARLASLLHAAKAQFAKPYFPAMRFGDVFIAVKPKNGTDMQSLGGYPEVKWFELVERPMLDDLLGKARPDLMTMPAVKERIAAIRAMKDENAVPRFGKDTHDIEVGNLTRRPDILRSIDLPALEKLMMLMENKVKNADLVSALAHATTPQQQANIKALRDKRWDQLYGKLLDTLHDQMVEELKAGWKRKANLTPGYSPDFDRAIAAHTYHLARNTADMIHRDGIESAYQNIQDFHPHQSVREYWKQWRDNNEAPTDPLQKMANTLNAVGFAYALGMNPASTFIMAAHTPLAAAPVLSQGIGPHRASAALVKALGEAYAKLRFDPTEGAHIDAAALGKTEAEQSFMRKLVAEGRLHALGMEDMAALSNRQAEGWGNVKTVMSRAFSMATSNVSAVDQANRAAIALASFRLAIQPSLLKRMSEQQMQHNAIFRDIASRGPVSPEAMARHMIDEAAFEWGKAARPPVQRGPMGTLLFSLHGFQTRYLSTAWRLMRNSGPEGKIAAAFMMSGLMAGAGVYGLPFTQDLENVGDLLWKKITGHDPMIDAHIRQAMEDSGFSKAGAEWLLRGPLSMAMNTDMAARVGFGDVLSRELSGNDVLGAVPTMLYERMAAAGKRYASGQGAVAASAELLPSALRNPARAAIETQQGVVSQSGNMQMPPSQITGRDIATQALGFRPLDQERAYQHNEYDYRLAHASKQQRTDDAHAIASMIYRADQAHAAGDMEKESSLRQQAATLIAQNPGIDTAWKAKLRQLRAPEVMEKKRLPKQLRGKDNPYP